MRRYAEGSINQGFHVMLSKYRSLALCAFFVLPVLMLSACGSDVPGNSVAKIGDQSIKKTTFDHWMQIAAVSAAGQANPSTTGTPKAQIPDAPNFTKCIANKKATAAKPAKGQPEPTEVQLKGQCQQQYNTLRDQVLEFLIRGNWIEQETSKQKVAVSDKEVQKQIDAAVKQAFQNPGDFQKFLQRSGLTQADVFYQQRNQLLQQKLTEKVTKAQGKVTDAQIAAYYNKNQSKFATPERRDLRIVLTKTQANAAKAKRALQSGQSWKSVTKKFSIDQASKAQGGLLSGVAKGQQEKALDDAIFKAAKGKLVGPVKTQFGYYILEVSKITAAKQQSLAQSKTSIQQILTSDNQRKALDTFGKDYRNRWKAETACRKGFTTADCKNGPKTQPTTATAPAAAQQPQTSTGTTTQP
ncbi:MAG: foldase protein PrsA [Solirubrobacteraceae bacterium]|jgi:foldase protein PrsA|nr:foldase protein PrsA [Solirubrobacteraceae bacterium]